ncbi:17724_t:CDS:2, partial [Funneliformis caledonium]
EDIRKKSEFSLKLTNLLLDTNGRYLISIESMEVAKNGETYFLDRKRLIWTDPNVKLCFNCQVPGHQSQNCRKNHSAPQD